MKAIKIRHDLKSFILTGIVLMQLSSAGQAFAGQQGSYVYLMTGFGLINATWIVALLATNFRGFVRALLTLFIFVVPLELIIALKQPAMLESQNVIFRFICYNLFLVGCTMVKLQPRDSSASSMVYSRLIPAIVVGSTLLYLSGFGLGVQALGRITMSEDVTAVGVGYTFASVAAITIALFFYEEKKLNKAIQLVSCVAALVPVLFTASRGPIIAFLLTSLFIAINQQRAGGSYRIMRTVLGLLAVAIFGGVGLNLLSKYVPTIELQLEYIQARFLGLFEGGDASSQIRMDDVDTYFSKLDEFWLTGMPGYDGLYPHNLLLDFFIRYGIYGLTLSIFLYFFTLAAMVKYRALPINRYNLAISSLFFFTFLNAQVSLTAEFMRGYWLALPYLFVTYFGHKAVRVK